LKEIEIANDKIRINKIIFWIYTSNNNINDSTIKSMISATFAKNKLTFIWEDYQNYRSS
jgi:hypothetical protein